MTEATPRVQPSTLGSRQPGVGHLLGERMLERVLELLSTSADADDVRRLERQECPVEGAIRCGHPSEDAVEELPPDDGCFAHDALLVLGEAIDAGGEDSSNSGGDRFAERAPQFPRPLATVERSSLEEAARQLLDEEGVAICAGDDEVA